MIFVIGLVMGSKLKAFDALPAGRKWECSSASRSSQPWASIRSRRTNSPGVFVLPWWLTVTKLPLSILEVARYCSLAIAAGVCWTEAGSGSATARHRKSSRRSACRA
ncbi:MAG: hypothetical protein QM754_14045 [Tepidisphaeraceae bacterium]